MNTIETPQNIEKERYIIEKKSMSEKKFIISFAFVVIGIITYFAYIFIMPFCFFYFLENHPSIITSRLKLGSKDFSQDSKSIPSNIKPYFSIEEPKGLKYGYKTVEEFYNNSDENKNIVLDEEYKPDNYEDYKNEFCEYVLERIKEPKTTLTPTIEEAQKLPSAPKFKSFRSSLRLWAHISILLDCEGYDKESLLVALCGYYLARDLESLYEISGSRLYKMIGMSLRNISSAELLRWASKPRKTPASFNRMISNDLLELVKNDYPLSRGYEIDGFMIKDIINCNAKIGNILAFIAPYTQTFEDNYNFYYESHKSYIDKPYYECVSQLERYSEEFTAKVLKVNEYYSLEGIITYAFSPVNGFSKLVLTTTSTENLKHYKENYETCMAKMELAAIAIAYNGYYNENKQIPNTMQELENWFGKELPINRLIGIKYKLHERDGFPIYNNGINNKYEYDANKQDKYMDDFYFKFIPNN